MPIVRDTADAWAAFEKQVLPHADRLFRIAMWFERSRADAEDLVQDAMMQARQSFQRFQPGTFGSQNRGMLSIGPRLSLPTLLAHRTNLHGAKYLHSPGTD